MALALGWYADRRGDLPAHLVCNFMQAALAHLSRSPTVRWADVAAVAWACAKLRYIDPPQVSALLDRNDI